MASAASMFLLASLYFGDGGSLAGCNSLVCMPRILRSIFTSALPGKSSLRFPSSPWPLYGFGAYARHGKRKKHWVIGVGVVRQRFCCATFPRRFSLRHCCLAFLGFTAWVEKPWAKAVDGLGGITPLGFATRARDRSSFVWLPALSARQDVSMNRALEGNGKYSNHFVYLHQLFYSPWGYGLSVPGPDDGMSFALGWSHLLLALLAYVWLSRAPSLKADRRLLRFFAAAAAILCVLMLEHVLWFWEQMPILQNVQLPWRLLGPVAAAPSRGRTS